MGAQLSPLWIAVQWHARGRSVSQRPCRISGVLLLLTYFRNSQTGDKGNGSLVVILSEDENIPILPGEIIRGIRCKLQQTILRRVLTFGAGGDRPMTRGVEIRVSGCVSQATPYRDRYRTPSNRGY